MCTGTLFGLPIMFIVVLLSKLPSLLPKSLGPQADEALGKVVEGTVEGAKELAGTVKREIDRGRIKGQLRKDLEFLDRQRRTGGITDDQYVDRVQLTMRQAACAIEGTSAPAELPPEAVVAAHQPEAGAKAAKPYRPISKASWERNRDELVAANRERTAKLRRRVQQIEGETPEDAV